MEPDPAPPARGNYFADDGFFQSDLAAGVTRDRAGTRVLALPEEFLAALDQTVADARVLHAAGRTWGRRLAERLERELSDYYGEPLAAAPLARFQAALSGLFRAFGWGVPTLDFGRYDTGLIVAEVRNAPPADALLAGAMVGLFSHFAGRELDGAPLASAGDVRRFVLALPERLACVADAVNDGRSADEVLAELEEFRV
jgi:hypothetical protein